MRIGSLGWFQICSNCVDSTFDDEANAFFKLKNQDFPFYNMDKLNNKWDTQISFNTGQSTMLDDYWFLASIHFTRHRLVRHGLVLTVECVPTVALNKSNAIASTNVYGQICTFLAVLNILRFTFCKMRLPLRWPISTNFK